MSIIIIFGTLSFRAAQTLVSFGQAVSEICSARGWTNKRIPGRIRKMNLEGANLGGLGDKSPPAGSRGGAPVGGLGDEVGAGDATYNNGRSPPEADDVSQLKG